ncbi:hypothetical protein [Jeongeupia sp. HS-3]|nr:hypothetical protein [Jeongeupia sp. HS-3]
MLTWMVDEAVSGRIVDAEPDAEHIVALASGASVCWPNVTVLFMMI